MSDGLFTALLNGVLVSGSGIPSLTFVTFVDENTLILSNPATSSATISLSFKRATQFTPYTVQVQPGTYLETTPIVVDSFINVEGMNRDTCVVVPTVPSTNTFIIKNNASIESLNVTNSSDDTYAVIIRDGLYSFISNVVFYNVNRAISFEAEEISYLAEVEGCVFVGGSGNTAVYINNTNQSLTISVSLSNLRCMQHFDSFFRLGGINTLVAIRNCALQGDGTGTVLTLYDSCKVNVQGLYIANWTTGFTNGDTTASSPYLAIAGLTQTLISGNVLEITNESTVGYFTGYVPYTQVSIPDASPFFVTNKDQKVIVVAKKGADFSTISAAIDSITDASTMNIYTIIVGPGIFVEPPLILKSYTSIRGAGYQATVIVCNQADSSVITGADSSLIYGCTFTGCTAQGGRAVYFEGTGTAPGSPFIIDNCILGSNHTLVSINASTYPAIAILTQCLYGASFDADEGVSITSIGGQVATLLVYNCVFQDLVIPVPQTLFDVDGDGALLVSSNTLVQLNGTNTSTAVRTRNGAGIRTYGCSFVGLNNGIVSENQGNAPGLVMAGTTFERCERMLTIEHPDTTGYFIGSVDISKVFIHPSAPFYVKDRVPTNLLVSKKGSDYTSIKNAIDYISTVVSVTVNVGSSQISRVDGLFDPSMDGCIISGSGIASGTAFTYVSPTSGLLNTPIEAQLLSNIALTSDVVVATILRASEITPYVISIQPGVYAESGLVIPKFTTLKGESTATCVVMSTTTDTVVSMSQQSCLHGITIHGSGGVGVRVDSVLVDQTTPECCIEDVSIIDCSQGIFVTGTLSSCKVKCTNVDVYGNGTYGILVDGTLLSSPHSVIALLSDVHIHLESINHTGICCEGPNATMLANICVVSGCNKEGTTGISINDGSTLVMTGSQVIETTLDGLIVLPDGEPPVLQCTGCTFMSNTGKDIYVEHPSAAGCINMATAQSVDIVESSTITVTYINPEESSISLTGIVKVGSTVSKSVDIVPYILGGMTVGVISGGEITVDDTVVTVHDGSGYLEGDGVIKLVEWVSSVLVLSSGMNYIHVNSTGTVIASLSRYDTLDYVCLGRVYIGSSGVEVVDSTPMRTTRVANSYDHFHRRAIGSVVAGGIQVSVDDSLHVTVTGGSYFLSGVEIHVIEDVGCTLGVYYGGVLVGHTRVVDNAFYDVSGSLVTIPSGEYVKHALYIVGGSYQRVMMVYGTSTHADVNDCVSSMDVLPPSYFNEGIILIANVIVQQGTTTAMAIDRRPIIVTSLGGLSSVSTHSNLQGLLDDDHPQYLLVGGSRAMAGWLDMNGNGIANVSSINGVTVESHASRHLPNGSDPLLTAEPAALRADTPNYAGVANSFSRSDHVHSIATGEPSTQRPDYPNTRGDSITLARADHQHNIPTDVAASVGSTNTQGDALTFSRSDHIHQGVHSVSVKGVSLYGDLTIDVGTGLTMSNNQGTVTLDTGICCNEFVATSTGLFVDVTQGRVVTGTVSTSIPQSVVEVPSSSEGVIYATESGVVVGDTFGCGVVPIATYTSTADTVSLTDVRVTIGRIHTPYNTRTLIVDSQYGSDTFGEREKYAYRTIASAVSVAVSGDIVYVNPGTYYLSGTLVVPSGVTINGRQTVIHHTVIGSGSSIVLSEGATLKDVRVEVECSVNNTILVGIDAQNNTTIENVTVNVTSTAIFITNISNVRTEGGVTLRRIVCSASYVGVGVVRSLVNDKNGNVNVYDSSLESVDVNVDGGTIVLRNTSVDTYIETVGRIILVGCDVGGTTTYTDSVRIGGIVTDSGVITVPLSTGELLTTTSTQTLTNKTIDDSSNVVVSTHLRTATGKVSIGGSVPAIGNVLVASSTTEAAWTDLGDVYSPGNGISIVDRIITNTGVATISGGSGVSVNSSSGSVVVEGSYSGGTGISVSEGVITNTGIVSVLDNTLVKVGSSVRGNYTGSSGVVIEGNVITSTCIRSVSSSDNTVVVSSGLTPTIRGNYVGSSGVVVTGNVISVTLSNVTDGGETFVLDSTSIKGLKAGNGITLSSSDTDIIIEATRASVTSDGSTIYVSEGEFGEFVLSGGYIGGTGIGISGNVITCTTATVSTAGGTYSLVSSLSSIKGLSSGSGISISTNTTSITITNSSPASMISLFSSGSVGSVSLVGKGTSPNLGIKGLVAGAGVSISATSADITISVVSSSVVTAENTTVTVSSPTIGAYTIRGNYAAGTGISILGNVITNTQSVELVSAGGVNSLVGPTSSGSVVSVKGLTIGSGIGISSTPTALTVTNTGVLSITGGTGVTVSGTVSNPVISTSIVGGSGIDVSGGVVSLSTSKTVSFNNPVTFSVSNSAFSPSAYFAWSQSLYGGLWSTGHMVFYVNVPATKGVDVRVYDNVNAVTLGSSLGIATSGTYAVFFENPTTDTYISFEFRRPSTGGSSPFIFGMQWSWNVA